jgi:hypothetical protein
MAERPATTSGELRDALAALLPGDDRELAGGLALVAEGYAAALLGGRHLSCARWLPRPGSTCGLAAGHLERCLSVAAARNQRMKAKRRAVRLQARKAAA